MQISVPKEIKDQKFRVGLSPSSVRVVTDRRHSVAVETGAGVGSGFSDRDYIQSGATIVTQAWAWDRDKIKKLYR
jgi:alanine dehydrogenase